MINMIGWNLGDDSHGEILLIRALKAKVFIAYNPEQLGL
jgi:hypothetical protein